MNTKIKLYLSYLIYNKPIIYISIFLLIGYIITTFVNNKLEEIRKEEQIRKDNISKLDKRKQKFIDSEVLRLKPIEDKERKLKHELDALKREITKTKECINGVKETLGTGNWYECNKEDNSIIQKASASEGVNSENTKISLLTPNELFYTTKKSDGCHISQNEQSHFTKAGGYMLATDVACDFDKNGKAEQAEVYAPDYLNKSYNYLLRKKKDDLLGDYVELHFCPNQNEVECFDTMKWIIGHTTTKLKDGDVVQTGQRIGQNNLTGYTTGYHSHIELWSLIDGKWKNISYTTRSETLNNKRNNILSEWKEGDKFYFTSYHIGDVNQNDSSPYIGASGKDLRNVTNPIALTIDVRKSLGIKLGDKVKLTGPCTGIYQVEDEMNQRFRYSNIMKDNYPIKGDIAIPLGTEAKCSGVYSITKI